MMVQIYSECFLRIIHKYINRHKYVLSEIHISSTVEITEQFCFCILLNVNINGRCEIADNSNNFVFAVLRIKSRGLCTPAKRSTTDLRPQVFLVFILTQVLAELPKVALKLRSSCFSLLKQSFVEPCYVKFQSLCQTFCIFYCCYYNHPRLLHCFYFSDCYK